MSIKCFFGYHDYEPFGDGIPMLGIISRSAHIKADALYLKEFETEIYESVRAIVMNKFFGDYEMKKFMLEHKKIRDEVCLRCGKIKPIIQMTRAATDSHAVFIGMSIKMREDRQAQAKRMIVFLDEDKNRCI